MSDKALAIIPKTIDEVSLLAVRFAKSALLPADLRGKEADVFVTILAGQELGLPPMAALRGIHVVKGKPVLSADTMVGVVMGRGIARYFTCVEETDQSVTYETHREGAPKAQRCTWTLDDAKRALLVDGDNWKKYPRSMLKARCKAMLARDVYPDVLAGCFDEDEARHFQQESANTNVIEAEFEEIPYTPVTPGILDKLDLVMSFDELNALAEELEKLQGRERADAIIKHRAARARIRASAKGGSPANDSEAPATKPVGAA